MRRLLAATVVALFVSGAADAHAAGVKIDVLSNRADLISGGDALVAVSKPKGRTVKVTLAGKDVTSQFAEREDGQYAALLTGIPEDGKPVKLRAELPNGKGAAIALVGYPNGGPVFSGPQLQPWVCQASAVDAQCNQPATYAFYAYVNGRFEQIDPQAPPSGVGTTTTETGRTVPFIVRVEVGYQDRDQYKLAALYDNSKPWTAFAPQDTWNRKLVITHGGSCGTDRQAGSAPDVFLPEVLGKGFMVASTALNNLGHNCNPVIIAESEIMMRERIVEQYGQVQRTLGTGCSGGAIAQLMTAHAYPGFYDGITVQCTFADLFTTGKQAANGNLLQNFFKVASLGAGGLYTPLDQAAVGGSPLATADDAVFDAAFWPNITGANGCAGLDPATRWTPSNPSGERCGVLDHNRNVLGNGPNGYVGVPLDNEGVQYGLKPLLAGTLSPAKFVDINARIGGLDKTTLEPVPQRTVADASALRNAYRAGYVAVGNTLGDTPILEGRGSNEATAHVTYPTLALNARLQKQFGTARSHAVWQGPVPLLGGLDFANRMIFAMDRWVANIQADQRTVPKRQKVLDGRPADIKDQCELANGVVVTEGLNCPAINRFYDSATEIAGESERNDILKCQLKPLRREDYPGVTFTDAQWGQLQATFASGVCDWDKPGVEQTETVPWMTFANKEGGEPMGAVPVSRSFRPGVRVKRPRRSARKLRRARTVRFTLVKNADTGAARGVRVRVLRGKRVVAASKKRTLRKRTTRVVVRRRAALGKGKLRVVVTGKRIPRRITTVR